MAYLPEFLFLAAAHFLAVASPGPDFAVVVKQSIAHGRRIAIWTSLGIAVGIVLHVAYSLLGIGLLISQSILLFNVMKWLAALYLLYIGIMALRAKAPPTIAPDQQPVSALPATREPSIHQAFTLGFLTNALNPKATLFFLSLFAVAVSAETPTAIKLGYGLYFAIATGAWFTTLSLLLGHGKVRAWMSRFGHWVERAMGGVLVALGLRLALSTSDIG